MKGNSKLPTLGDLFKKRLLAPLLKESCRRGYFPLPTELDLLKKRVPPFLLKETCKGGDSWLVVEDIPNFLLPY